MHIGTISWPITVGAFAGVGWVIARKRSQPAGPLMFIIVLGVAVIGYFVGVNTRLVDVGGLEVPLNWALTSCCVGGVGGLLIRNRELRRSQGK